MPRYPDIEPYETGLLDTGDGNLVYWETCGNPDGVPALIVHGGPGVGLHGGKLEIAGPGEVPDRHLRPAQLRPQPAARQPPRG
jgi:hypothetical protein